MSTYTKKDQNLVAVNKGTTAPAQQQNTAAAAPAKTNTTAAQTVNYQQEPVDRTQYQYDASSNEAYQQALNALLAAQKETPTYAGTYDAQLDEIYNNIVNRKPFRYDVNEDMLYQQYVEQYRNLGNLAMRDTMGQAAALTGGYGNSYAQSVGQQQYNAYLQNVNEVVPELYGMAQDQYNREGDALMQQYSMTGDLADREYGKYQDALNNYWQNVSYLQGQADTEYNRGYENFYNAEQMGMQQDQMNYQKYLDEYDRNFQQEQWQYQQEQDAYDRQYQELMDNWNKSFQESQFAYQKEQDSLSNEWRDKEYQQEQAQIAYEKQLQAYSTLSELITATGYVPSAAELQAAGMSQAQADAYRSYYAQQNAQVAASRSSDSGSDAPIDEEEEEKEEEEEPSSVSFSSYNVKQMLEENGDDVSDLVDEYTWNAQKRYAMQTGQHATDITTYNSYQEYLKHYINEKGYEW